MNTLASISLAKTIPLPQSLVASSDVVVLERSQWERFQVYIKELQHAIRTIGVGEQDIKTGKAIRTTSITQALKLYGRKTSH